MLDTCFLQSNTFSFEAVEELLRSQQMDVFDVSVHKDMVCSLFLNLNFSWSILNNLQCICNKYE